MEIFNNIRRIIICKKTKCFQSYKTSEKVSKTSLKLSNGSAGIQYHIIKMETMKIHQNKNLMILSKFQAISFQLNNKVNNNRNRWKTKNKNLKIKFKKVKDHKFQAIYNNSKLIKMSLIHQLKE